MLSVLRNTGSGIFGPKVDYPVDSEPQSVAVLAE
jgi:hypothetical protein